MNPITLRPAARAAAVLTALVLSLGLSACGGDAGQRDAGVRTVGAAEAVSAAQQEGVVVLDVRTPGEFAAGHLAGARNVPLGDAFSDEVGKLERTGRYVLYCQSGNRSAQAADIMSDLGFTDVRDAGGLASLADAGGVVVAG